MTEKHSQDERGLEADETSGDVAESRSSKRGSGGFLEFLIILLVAFALVFGFVRPFVMEAFYIPSESMVPTLEVGDRIFVNKFVYRFSEPERRDIVVFDSIAEDDDQTLIKRVVGVAGDEIQVQSGVLYVNGEEQEEPYLNYADQPRGSYGPTVVPEGHIFVMGDNRNNSADSRVFGPLPLENLKGEAFMRFWPVSEISAI